MALTAGQKAEVRLYLGWTARWGQVDTALDMSLSALETQPAAEALVTNPLDGSPPGLLALLRDTDEKILNAHGRLKASKVGSIVLNEAEIDQLRDEGRRLVGRLSTILGVSPRSDVFSGSLGASENYVGK